MYSDATGLGAEEAPLAAMFESDRFELHHVACGKTRNCFSIWHIQILFKYQTHVKNIKKHNANANPNTVL